MVLNLLFNKIKYWRFSADTGSVFRLFFQKQPENRTRILLQDLTRQE